MQVNAIIKKRRKYLSQYAELTTKSLEKLTKSVVMQPLQNALVIPAYQESVSFINRLLHSKLAKQDACFVIVINQPNTDFNTAPQQQLLDDALCLGELVEQVDNLYFVKLFDCSSMLLLVDCFNQPLPSDQGVGLARKIGCDLVIALQELNILHTKLFGSSDADAFLPESYFDLLKNTAQHNKNISALCFDFSHQYPKEQALTDGQQVTLQATQAYESALRYYVAGLTFAGSRYDFFTIGSILAISTSAYVDVRGFVKKSAGEDFYTLNKLAKVGDVARIKGQPIVLTPRLSTRVPFGTGPAVREIIDLQNNNIPYEYYHFECFVQLKYALAAISELLEDLKQWQTLGSVDIFEDWNRELNEECKKAFIAIGFIDFITKQIQVYQGNHGQLVRQIHDWFDAFKTLKFIHSIRTLGYADMPIQHAILQAPFNTPLTTLGSA